MNFVQLPFLTQEEWDKILCTSDFNFVRGEESLARACLSGKPFFWHAYVQDENYQLVKVNALLEKMLPFVCGKNLKTELSTLWNEYNTPDAKLNENALYDFFQKAAQGELTAFFENFSENLFQNGNFAKNLLNFLETLQ